MIQEDQVAERVAIDSYREMIASLGNEDPTTRRMLGGIAFSRVCSARPTRDSSHAHVMNVRASCDERRAHPDMPGRHVIMT